MQRNYPQMFLPADDHKFENVWQTINISFSISDLEIN